MSRKRPLGEMCLGLERRPKHKAPTPISSSPAFRGFYVCFWFSTSPTNHLWTSESRARFLPTIVKTSQTSARRPSCAICATTRHISFMAVTGASSSALPTPSTTPNAPPTSPHSSSPFVQQLSSGMATARDITPATRTGRRRLATPANAASRLC
ncbi:hypothetical protein GX50_07284 [[Emmonsia] crescens]|uniref:Uncharacterized protein n=1 Tax=[Emmonsia] crescens TaxID=73230 RepID=A0A2B7Z9Q2_9EURO|nr:hypothetical protein GX50_07284 [Emmonsia crescens]